MNNILQNIQQGLMQFFGPDLKSPVAANPLPRNNADDERNRIAKRLQMEQFMKTVTENNQRGQPTDALGSVLGAAHAQEPQQMQQAPQAVAPPPVGAAQYFDYSPYRVAGNYEPPQPPPELAPLFFKYFPEEATKAALTAATENGGFNPNAVNKNSNGSTDLGIFQINSDSYNDRMKHQPDVTQDISPDYASLSDVIRNFRMAQLLQSQGGGWGRWYGPKNRGFDIVNR